MVENHQTLDDARWWRFPKVSRVWLAFLIVTVYLVATAPTVQMSGYTLAVIFVGYSFGRVIHGKESNLS